MQGLDWYDWLTPEFKLSRDAYTVNDKAAFSCPRCGAVDTVRINHLKEKLKKLGRYECAKCRQHDAIMRAREACRKKYDGANPFSLTASKQKIKKKIQAKFGVDCYLKNPEIHRRGIAAASTAFAAKRTYAADFSKITVSSAENPREWYRQYNEIRRVCDPGFTPRRAIYSALKRMLKGQAVSATNILKNIGYSTQELRRHIESQFKEGMTWENHGTWHVDHKIPLTAFDCTDIEQVKKANALTNLQPLWAADNIRKRNHY